MDITFEISPSHFKDFKRGKPVKLTNGKDWPFRITLDESKVTVVHDGWPTVQLKIPILS